MRRGLSLAIVLLVAACSGGDVAGPTTPPQSDPAVVVANWLEAVGSNDTSALTDLVEPRGLAVIAGVESNLRSGEFVALVESGMSDALQAQYWSQFRDDFTSFSGIALTDLSIGSQIGVAAPGFASVELVADEALGRVILRETDVGWQVDFPATIGPSLIGPLGQYLASAVDGDNAASIAATYRDFVTPGLDAALALDPANARLQFEAEYIRQLAESAAPTP